MRTIGSVVIVGAAVGLLAGNAHAQSCAGFASLENARANVGGNAWFADGVTTYGGHLNLAHRAMGHRNFLSLGVGAASYDAPVSETSVLLSAAAGIEMTTTNRIDWCPMLSVGYEIGPGDDVSGLDLGVGVGASKAMGSLGDLALVPFGSAGWLRSASTAASTTVSDNAFAFGAGVGFRLGSGIQLSPQVSKTTFSGSKAVWGLTLSIPIGTN